MENGPFIDDFPIKTPIYEGFSMAMSNNQMATSKKTLDMDWFWTSTRAWIFQICGGVFLCQPKNVPTHPCRGLDF
jgi:hypothetical protein